jgi:hypothetical protein
MERRERAAAAMPLLLLLLLPLASAANVIHVQSGQRVLLTSANWTADTFLAITVAAPAPPAASQVTLQTELVSTAQFMAQFISFAAGALPTTNSPFCEGFVAPGQTGQGAFCPVSGCGSATSAVTYFVNMSVNEQSGVFDWATYLVFTVTELQPLPAPLNAPLALRAADFVQYDESLFVTVVSVKTGDQPGPAAGQLRFDATRDGQYYTQNAYGIASPDSPVLPSSSSSSSAICPLNCLTRAVAPLILSAPLAASAPIWFLTLVVMVQNASAPVEIDGWAFTASWAAPATVTTLRADSTATVSVPSDTDPRALLARTVAA